MKLQVFGRHPVFRGFEALGIGATELARIFNVAESTVHAWQRSAVQLPAPWAILLTDYLGAWLTTPPEPLRNHPASDDVNHAADREASAQAQNWHELALESLKDLPKESHEAAKLLRDRKAIAA